MKIKPKTKFKDLVIKLITASKDHDNHQFMVPVMHENEEYVVSIMVIPKAAVLKAQQERDSDKGTGDQATGD